MAGITSAEDLKQRLRQLKEEKGKIGEAETLHRLLALFTHCEKLIDTMDGRNAMKEWGKQCIFTLVSDTIADDKDVLQRCLKEHRELLLVELPIMVELDADCAPGVAKSKLRYMQVTANLVVPRGTTRSPKLSQPLQIVAVCNSDTHKLDTDQNVRLVSANLPPSSCHHSLILGSGP